MSGVRVKVCGITRSQDVAAAQAAGVDLLGFNLAQGPRRVSVPRAAALIASLGPWCQAVALFVDAPPAQVLSDARACGAQLVQLHGRESPQEVALLSRRIRVIKALRVRDAADIARAHDYAAAGASALLLDAYVPGLAGGSGQRWDYRLLSGEHFACPLMVAGGLHPGNALAAARATGASAVDVASGVEYRPGIKSAGAMRALVAALAAGEGGG